MNGYRPVRILCLLLTALGANVAQADVRPADLFSDNMVFQQDTDAAVWGFADPGEKVRVSASWGESANTIADSDGRWSTTLKTPKAVPGQGQVHSVVFEGANRVEIGNVLIGEVWLASGQSNMEWRIKQLKIDADQLGDSNLPLIREYPVERNATPDPAADTVGNWMIASGETVEEFSATAWFFARHLHQSLDVPVGIINSTWGGTPIESWLSRESQSSHGPTQDLISRMDRWNENYDPVKSRQEFESELATWEAEKANAASQGVEFSQRKPRQMTPQARAHRYPGNLYAGMIHPLKPFSIRGTIWYQGEANSHSVEQALFYERQLTDLINSWRNDWQLPDMPFYVVQLANFRAPQTRPVEPDQYWPITRESMRKVTSTLPYTGMALAIDIGDAGNIHPQNKWDLGHRLALLALYNDYGHDLVPSGPLYRSHVIKDNRVLLNFAFKGSGLVSRGDEKLHGFAIAGDDGDFVWADAKIITNPHDPGTQLIEVSSPMVKRPKSVRYGWADNPDTINLYNVEGLPASPFSTD